MKTKIKTDKNIIIAIDDIINLLNNIKKLTVFHRVRNQQINVN